MTPTATQPTVAELEQALDAAPAAPALPTAGNGPAGDGGLPAAAGIVIVGGGFGGLATAIRLKQSGREDFVLVDRGDGIGGTWRDNTYPGCRCDVPSHLYSLSFAPNPHWSESFSQQSEIHAYMRGLVDRFGLAPHIHTGCEVEAASWVEADGAWETRTSLGTIRSRFLVAAVGGLVDPNIPDIPGLDSFPGKVFHSARWDHDHDLAGERVAVVGTGASAIQFVPRIQPEVSQLHLFQRTAPWITPRINREISRLERAAFARLPVLQRIARGGIYWARELVARGLLGDKRMRSRMDGVARKHLARQVPDPELRAKLTPDYEIGCKRILISNDYYPSLGRDNVEVVTEGVAEVRGSTVVGSDGTEAEVDTIIFGTGFHVTDTPAADLIHGVGGRSLRDVWAPSMHAHRGTTIAGFPNMFMLGGAHTGIGHTSLTVMLEAQVEYLIDALAQLDARGHGRIEVKPEAQQAFLEELDRKMEGTVWTSGGCQSWYLDSTGRNTTLWPDYTFRFRSQMKHANLSEFTTAPARVPVA